MPSPVAPPAPSSTPGTRSVDPLVALADRCVQCGLCLPSCPTYRRSALEAESPRGRIALARAWALATIPPTPTGEAHLDHCLGCRACEAVCPAGVEFGALLVQARQRQRERRPPGLRERAVLALVARPRPLGALLRIYRVLFSLLPSAWRPLPRPPATAPAPAGMAAGPVAFVGCIAQAWEAEARQALARLCAAAGTPLAPQPPATCCGALHAHAGDAAGARRLAEANRAAFAGAGTVLTLASGCHEALAQALDDPTPRVVDAATWLANRADILAFLPTPERVALHLPCTQRNVVGSVGDLRLLLSRVPGLEVVELDPALGCCGAAGMHMLDDPEAAAAYRAPLLERFEGSGATVLLSANLGCRLHLAAACTRPVLHPLEFLAQRLAP